MTDKVGQPVLDAVAELLPTLRERAQEAEDARQVPASSVKALEEALARPVLTANQVAFWHALRLSGARAEIVDYGEIFGRELPARSDRVS